MQDLVNEIRVIIAFVAKDDLRRGIDLNNYLYPAKEEMISPSERVKRFGLVTEATIEVGEKDVTKVMKKLTSAYHKAGEGKLLPLDEAYDVIMEKLGSSKNANEEFAIFKRYVDTVVSKVK